MIIAMFETSGLYISLKNPLKHLNSLDVEYIPEDIVKVK